ncbi:MAG TPA: trypsin-like peptidase domain-containing protein [Planctomycetaceae bacterium]|nr:trypsin-like peptidase domain-containing protein [Planctomycetaceae bacterium]
MKTAKRYLIGGTLIALSAFGCLFLWNEFVEAQAEPGGPAPLTAEEQANLDHATSLSRAFRTASERVLPAVVTIRTEVRQEPAVNRGGQNEIPDQLRNDPFFRRFFEDLPEGFERLPRRPQEGMGSGVIIDPSGLILTNNHVVRNGSKVVVRLHDGREFEATKVTADPRTDLAIVQIEGQGKIPYAALGDSDSMTMGDWVIAVGAPFRLQESVTAGIISGKSRVIGINDREEYLQTDAAINPGNSGGPLVNLAGEVIGINTAISTTSGGYQGIGFAIPANLAKWVVDQLQEHGEVKRAYLGVLIHNVTSQLADQLGLKEVRGAFVAEVKPDGPAGEAGVKVGDIILEFAGKPVNQSSDLQRNVERSKLNSTQNLVVYRDGKRETLSVKVAELPKDLTTADFSGSNTESVSLDGLGIEARNLDEETAKQLGLNSSEGVLVTTVQRGSLAENAGIEAGSVIIKLGQDQIKDVKDLQQRLSKLSLAEGVVLTLRTSEGSRIVYIGSR